MEEKPNLPKHDLLMDDTMEDIYVEEQVELSEVAGTWASAGTFTSASTFGSCAATASTGGSASSFG